MAELHDALGTLAPIDWEDVPQDNLADYLSNAFDAAELIANSVPQMPEDGVAFPSAQPHFDTPNQASEAKSIVASSARSQQPHQSHSDLQKSWGKPVKINAKENPLHAALYKMAGHDRRGAWFARRSIHEGIGFLRFKSALQREFPESMREQGPPGAGAKRGLAADRVVEKFDVPDKGQLVVYELSAQMPPPVSTREFLTLLLSTEGGLTEKSAALLESGDKHVPRHFMVVSRPTTHPDAPPRSNFVRGQYESVEMIREIPLHKSKSKSDLSSDDNSCDPEVNPVEWIMITRSDPGGGIPRFMVDRGTPGAMLTDMTKFLDWACSPDVIASPPDNDRESQPQAPQNNTQQSVPTNNTLTVPGEKSGGETVTAKTTGSVQPTDEERPPSQSSGMMSTLATTVQAGISAYAPTSVSKYMQSHNRNWSQATENSSDDESDTSSSAYLSAEELRRLGTAPEYPTEKSSESLSLVSGVSTPDAASITSEKKKLNRHEKELRKIAQKRERLELDLTKRRSAEEAKFRASQEKGQSASEKARETLDREIRKADERHRKEMQRLEDKRARETQKAEEKRRKKDEADRLSMVARERDHLRDQMELSRRETELLQAQVESLQRENAALVARLAKIDVQNEVKNGEGGVDVRSAASSTNSG